MVENRDKLSSRDEVLALLGGQRNQRTPCFSGLISITAPGLESAGLRLSEIHTDSTKMAAAAATTYHLFGFESVVLPLDLCVEAGVLGAEVDFRADAPRLELPKVVSPLAESCADLSLKVPPDLTQRERVSTVIEAINILKKDIGQEVAIGAWIPGPLTLAMQLVNVGNLMREVATGVEDVSRILDPLTDVLVTLGLAYHLAGADFITVHEMGGSPGFIGPPAFKKLVLPQLQRLLAALPAPRVLSICGDTNRAMPLLAEAGADALSVDQTNDLAQSRAMLGSEVVLLGNIDPVGKLANGDEAGVRRAVVQAIEAGADAVWPGCDLWPQVPAANIQAMVDETRRYRRA
jgi:MtaA/CmuA family methyltransferase